MTAAPKRTDPASEEDSVHTSNNSHSTPNETVPTKKPSRKKWFIIGGIVVLVVLVLSLTLGLYYGLNKVSVSYLSASNPIPHVVYFHPGLGKVFDLKRD